MFTERIGEWWPLKSKSIHGERAQTVVLEPREGGRMYELSVDGEDAYWGTVLAWEPPRRLLVSWKVDPARVAPTEWEIRFEPEGEGTRVEFEHRGWERCEDGAGASANYTRGWELILGLYAGAAAE